MSVIEFDSMGELICHTSEDVHLESLMSSIILPTADDTQTALAKANVFLSETTAIRWRKERTFVQIVKTMDDSLLSHGIPDPDTSTTDCTTAAKKMWNQIFMRG